MSKAAYRIVEETEDVIYIEDLCGQPGHTLAKSITNDAEQVVETLLHLSGNKKIVYKDTEGSWDELVHDGKVFLDFGIWKGRLPNIYD